ncbi:NUDIX hydrolase [Caldibacillus thermolactis]|uniref:NUDIX hydrolase n=1 Tax=Pallidibacillus thermolactis TaxID=251051 RepID=A0ABT2WIZ6_9BACI|nr:NUDIX hydrolase [Pallidibacillus thermolactis]MCU9600267.1 NUDIX hydrolase [Pallidibacillus thermolactis subsp. kokeshiiformis]
MSKFEERTIHRKTIFEGRIIDLYLDEVSLPNGKTSSREIIKHPGAVAVIAITEEEKILLVEQYRKALERTLIEIPAGKLEKGEDPRESAKRELMEETGYTCENLEHITSFYTSPGFANELVHIYQATGLKQERELQLDEDEFVSVMEVTYDEALNLVKEQKIFDAKTMYAVQYWQMLKQQEK